MVAVGVGDVVAVAVAVGVAVVVGDVVAVAVAVGVAVGAVADQRSESMRDVAILLLLAKAHLAEDHAEITKLYQFKALVHKTLTEWGIGEHADQDCRIASRLDELGTHLRDCT